MRFGAQEARSSIRRYLPAGAAVGAAICALAANPALADLILRPSLTLEQIFTDNVRADGADRDADGVTVLTGNLLAQLETSNIIGLADVNVFYNEFWATNDLDSGNAVGTVAARAEILNNFLFVDAIATKQDVYLQPTDQSASGLTTGQGSLQQMNWAVSPFITSDLFGLADLEVRGNYAQVQFDEPVVGIAATLISDITVKQAGARITTGQRHTLYELVGTAEYLESDQGFEQRNVIGGAILNVTKNLSLIGRYGYERIADPSLTPTIKGSIWSAGGRFRLGPQSAIQFEYGHRFDDVTYLAQIDLALSPRLQVTGNYTDALVPIQLTLVRNVVDLLDQDGNFIISAPNAPSIPDPTLVDAIVRDKEMRLQSTYTRDLQTWTMTLGHTEREFPTLNDDESFFFAGLVLQEKLSRQLDYVLNLRFQDNYATLVTNTTSQIYTTELAVVYQFTEDVTFGGGYAWRLETTPGDNDVYENVLRFSVTQAY
jgi:uncharacterized protein (PEP-CTERM system associated)